MDQEEKFLEIQKEMLHELRAIRLKVNDAVYILNEIDTNTENIPEIVEKWNKIKDLL